MFHNAIFLGIELSIKFNHHNSFWIEKVFELNFD